MKIAIIGAGSLGTIIGALITEGGQKVDLIDSNQEHVHVLNENGATITGFVNKTVPVHALLPSEMTDVYDLVFILTKQVYNSVVLENLLPHLHEDSVVCTLQNGVPEEFVAEKVGKHRTVGGAVGFGATWIKPGVSELTTEWEVVQKYAFDIGELNGQITPRIKDVKNILDLVGNTSITTNILGIKWAKLLMNTTFSGMSAALGCTFGDVLFNDRAMFSLAHIADETIKVARADGIKLEPIHGKDMTFLELSTEDNVKDKMDFYHEVWGPHVKLKASMLQDIEKGNQTEIDYINGVVSAKGKELGVETPYNDLVVKLVKTAEKNKEVPSFKINLQTFESPKLLNQN